MKPVIIAAIVIGVLGWLALGLLFAQGPQPEIIVPAEVLTKVGPLNITNTLFTSWCVMAFLIIVSVLGTRSMKLMPSGLQNFLEASIGFLVDQMADIAGEKKARVFFPVIATIFIYVIISNWMGLLPFFNAVGNLEDVNHHVTHELTAEHPDDLVLAEDGTVEEGHKFAGWIMEGDSGVVYTKSGAKAIDFEVHDGESREAAFDRYIVFVARNFADYDVDEEVVEHPTPEQVVAAAALLDGEGGRPLLITAGGDDHGAEGEGESEAHGLESPALNTTVEGVDFEGAQKFALVIPWFRGTFSDINNTLALGLIAFFMIEFWGFKFLGIGYLGKFFVNPIKSPIGAFVGALELLSEFIRVISFAFRLFGNIFAGEVLLLMLTFLMPFLFVDIIYGLELFVGFIQASVFALLTLVFATMATESHGEEHHEDHDDKDGPADAHHHGAAQAHHA